MYADYSAYLYFPARQAGGVFGAWPDGAAAGAEVAGENTDVVVHAAVDTMAVDDVGVDATEVVAAAAAAAAAAAPRPQLSFFCCRAPSEVWNNLRLLRRREKLAATSLVVTHLEEARQEEEERPYFFPSAALTLRRPFDFWKECIERSDDGKGKHGKRAGPEKANGQWRRESPLLVVDRFAQGENRLESS